MQRLGFFILLCLITTVGWAQKISVSGIVFDESGSLPGASVIVKGSEADQLIGTVTDLDGNFTLETAPNSILVISFMGYQSQEVSLEGRTSLKIQLVSETTELDQVLVVGYGVQKKASSVAAISQTKGEDLLKVGSPNTVSEALQGIMPGVTAIVDNGKPGASSAEILIRGKASWQNSGPLVLVDGVERNMNELDPNEIENISVLKDASATAVFGVKGANGVILITTKRGTLDRPVVSFSANFGFKVPTAQPDFADYVSSMKAWNEALANDKRWSDMIPESTISAWEGAFATGNYGPYNDEFPQVDWWGTMVKDVGYQQNYNINVRGGSDFMKYFLSLGYLNDGDIFETKKNELFDPSFNYKRYNWRANFDFSITKSTTFSVNISGSQGNRNQTGYRINGEGEDGFGQDQFFAQLYGASQNLFPIRWSDGTYGVDFAGGGNLVALFDMGQRTYKYYEGYYDFKLKQDLDFVTKGLSTKLSVSYNSESNTASRIQRYSGGNFGEQSQIAFSRIYDYSQLNSNGTYPYVETRWQNDDFQSPNPGAVYDYMLNGGFRKHLYYELALNYNRTFGVHTVTALALFSRRENEYLLGGSSNTFGIPRRQEDWVGRVTYNYKERYLAEINGAYNGSENFAPGSRFGFFPSATIGWRISEEPLVKEIAGSWLTNLKARYSYGQSGMDRLSEGQRFAYLQNFNSGGNVSFGDYNRTNYGPLYNEGPAANESLTWEVSTKENLGFEFTFFEKLSGSLDLYEEKRENILMDVWSPLWYVQKSATGNIGETKNHGLEFDLGWSENIGANFRYSVKGNIALNDNRIVFRNDGANAENYQRQAGKPIGWQSRYLVADYYQSLDDIFNGAVPNDRTLQSNLIPGDFMFIDYNADGVIDEDGDKVVVKDLQYPGTTYGLQLGAQYKGWGINTLFYGVTNVSKLLPNTILYDNLGGEQGVFKSGPDVMNRWTLENAANAEKPAFHSLGTISGYSQSASTFSYQDASYLRLKNVEISYKFKKSFIQKFGFENFELYCNGNNLITWTKLDKRLDPETRNTSVYPIVRRYNLGVRASF
ncbi:SusC/RagA family TonB-linked outer membrane protein [Draconibacterium sediminis]|uniref:TonB-dependent receptor plug domain-containing protein n=1 Tax=Draconibacterium sediminis TaxID=1544798 RepID=A0A0D8JEL7_9BACT|nr:TonB-dependent receptor [Draconibacterium sediminis]KJF45345.1 hypothetical protein LH29_08200 [Draconibacterium sediminis]